MTEREPPQAGKTSEQRKRGRGKLANRRTGKPSEQTKRVWESVKRQERLREQRTGGGRQTSLPEPVIYDDLTSGENPQTHEAYYDEVRRAVGRGAPTVLLGTSTRSLERSLAKLTAEQQGESTPTPRVVPEKVRASEEAEVTSIHVNARPWLWAGLVILVGLLGWLIASKDWWLGLLIALVPIVVGVVVLYYVSMVRDRGHFIHAMLHLPALSFDIEVASPKVASSKEAKDREAEHQSK